MTVARSMGMPVAQPTFSVVIASYNRAHTIVAAVQSVLDQDYCHLEVLVIDDGSTDDTVGLLKQITDPRLSVHTQKNGGASAARNRGIDLAKGVYVAFLDSDDLFLPNHLRALRSLLEQGEDVVAYSAIVAHREHGRMIVKPYRGIAPGENMATYLMCDRGFLQTSAVAMRQSTAARVRYREGLGFGDDTDFAVRLQLDGNRFLMTSSPSVIWTDISNGDRLSHIDGHVGSTNWLTDLRPFIPRKAYYGYLGWHVAKGQMSTGHRIDALRGYAKALAVGSYSPRMAWIIFWQIFLPTRAYRWIANQTIALMAWRRRTPLNAATRTVKIGDGPGGYDPDRRSSPVPHVEA